MGLDRATTSDDLVASTQSRIESLLEVTSLSTTGPDDTQYSFTNSHGIWLPPDARGIYGGLCIAQSLVAAQHTVPPGFVVHSMHGQFAVAGNAEEALIYEVVKVNDGKSFATRTVNVVQRQRTIFTTIINFVRLASTTTTKREIKHSESFPKGIPEPPGDDATVEAGSSNSKSSTSTSTLYPYLTKKIGLVNSHSANPHEKYIHQWSKANGNITSQGGTPAHLAALAYICDNYFVGTTPHVHGIWNFVKPPLTEFDVEGPDPALVSAIHTRIPRSTPAGAPAKWIDGRKEPRIGMMVTLSHTMFFHAPAAVRADEWMLAEYRSHWAGDGRGLATQKIWSRDGVLLATCVQEGIIRLEDPDRGGEKQRARSRL